MKKTINFDGVELTQKMIEKVYRYQQLEYTKMDAINHLKDYKESGDLSSIEYDLLLKKGYPDALAQEFLDNYDCNIAENDIWDTIITNTIKEEFNKTHILVTILNRECRIACFNSFKEARHAMEVEFFEELKLKGHNIDINKIEENICYEGDSEGIEATSAWSNSEKGFEYDWYIFKIER